MKNETNVRRPEWKSQMLICTLVSAEKLCTRLGQIATVWATTILLGGFVSGLSSYDFWVISAIALASTLRLFGSTEEHKLNHKSHRRRHVLVKWLFGGHKDFNISSDTVVAGSLDLLMFLLQLASALVSLALSILRICQHNFGEGANQKDAMQLYYTMVLVEASLFLPAKICWELPSPTEYKKLIFKMTYDRERLSKIFDVFEGYFMKVLTTARQSVVQGLEMSLRGYISDLLESRNDVAACILILETLYEPGAWIKIKDDAEKRAKLLPCLFQHIHSRNSDHESREAALSLVTSLLVNKTNAPKQCKFGPLVLLRALDSHPEAVHILTGECSLARPVAKYLETCLASANKNEVSLGIDVVGRLPSKFLLSTRIVEVMAEQINGPVIRYYRHLAAMMVLTLGKHGLHKRIDSVQASRAVEVLIRRTSGRELQILVGLDAIGLISREQKKRVDIANLFQEDNFMKCLPWIVEWVSSLDDETFHEIFEKRLNAAAKESLAKHVESSRVNIRPDLIKFCRLLVRDSFFKSKIEQSPILKQLLQPEEEC